MKNWKEVIVYDFDDNIFVEGWLTDNIMEMPKVIAKINIFTKKAEYVLKKERDNPQVKREVKKILQFIERE